jgi:uncharacterized membrane protein
MERIICVVFDNETKAYDGSKALNELDTEGSISIHAKAVIVKKADGKTEIKDEGDEFPIRTIGGTAIGALIGLLGGPVGMGIGAVTGTFAGSVFDMDWAGVNTEYLEDVSEKLSPGKWAVVADISEEWETPLDTRMTALQGTVFRTSRRDYVREQDAKDVASIKADIALLKEEQAKSSAEHKAKIQKKIDSLNKKLNVKQEKAKQRSERRKEEAKAKIEALEKKASKAKGEAKRKIEARIAEMKEKEKKDLKNYDYWLNVEGYTIHY